MLRSPGTTMGFAAANYVLLGKVMIVFRLRARAVLEHLKSPSHVHGPDEWGQGISI